MFLLQENIDGVLPAKLCLTRKIHGLESGRFHHKIMALLHGPFDGQDIFLVHKLVQQSSC